MNYPIQYDLLIDNDRWCKDSLNTKKPCRKGTVTNRIIKQMKIKKKKSYQKYIFDITNELANLYTFTRLSTEIYGDGNSEITAQN